MEPTINKGSPGEWAPYFGSEKKRAQSEQRVTICSACGGKRMALGGPHSPRWAGGVMVDCVGNEVTG